MHRLNHNACLITLQSNKLFLLSTCQNFSSFHSIAGLYYAILFVCFFLPMLDCHHRFYLLQSRFLFCFRFNNDYYYQCYHVCLYVVILVPKTFTFCRFTRADARHTPYFFESVNGKPVLPQTALQFVFLHISVFYTVYLVKK